MQLLKRQAMFTALLTIWLIAPIQTASSYSFRSANRRQAKILETSMDLHAKPCDDFYKYACGKWEQNQVEPDKFHETISMVDYYNNLEMACVIRRMNLSNKPKFMLPVSDYYKSCMAVEEYKLLEYLRWLKYEEGIKWTTLWGTNKTNVQFDWLSTLATLRRYGLNGILLEMITLQRRDEPLKTILDIDKPVQGGGMIPLTFSNLEVLIKATTVPMSERRLQNLWKDISNFEKKLAELDELEDDDGNQLLTVKELPLEWLKQYIRGALNVSQIDPEMTVSMQNVPYMLALDKLLKRYEPRWICKYLEIRLLWHLHLEGPTNFGPVDCAQNVRSLIPVAMHWLFEHSHPELAGEKEKIHALFRDMIRHLKQALQSNPNSFNATTLEYLLAKVDSVQLKVNNLPRNQTERTLTEFYKDLQLEPSEFYANHLKLMRFNFKIAIDKLYVVRLPTNIDEFFFLESTDTASSSSPYFIQGSNVAVVPLTLLQHPIYHPDLEDIYRYSSLGFMLAHEITYGFDATGLEVDFSGKIGSPQYDSILANPRFDENYNFLLSFNPSVVDEKIADVSGLKLAYHAFFALHPESVNQTRRIYGSDMPMPKVFFLNFAQFFCGISKESEYLDITEHGLNHDRVIDALSNFPEFSKVFSCQLKDAMNAGKSCQIWR